MPPAPVVVVAAVEVAAVLATQFAAAAHHVAPQWSSSALQSAGRALPHWSPLPRPSDHRDGRHPRKKKEHGRERDDSLAAAIGAARPWRREARTIARASS